MYKDSEFNWLFRLFHSVERKKIDKLIENGSENRIHV